MYPRFIRSLNFLIKQLLFARSLFLVVAYSAIFVFSLFFSYQLRFEFVVPRSNLPQIWDNLLLVVPLKLLLLFLFGQFGVLLSYFRLPDLYRVLAAIGIANLVLVVLWYVLDFRFAPPRSVIVGDFIMSFLGVVTFRTALRVWRERMLSAASPNTLKPRRVAIVGAGQTGSAIAYDLLTKRGLGMRPVIFLDDDRDKWRKQIHGIPVVDSPDSLLFVKEKYGIETVILAMSTASARRVAEISENARQLGMRVEIVPSLSELSTGQVKASRIRPVDIEDLLGRAAVSLDSDQIKEMIHGKIVMVTGAGGSIGSELCRQIMSYVPKRLLMVEQCEVQMFHVETAIAEEGHSADVVALVGDVVDENRMRGILSLYQPQLIFHAAAHKHVPIMERQPAEAIKNNSFGTALLADLAVEYGVERFVLISTDKAINPTNVMGVSKRLAEIYMQAKYNANPQKTKFMAVRFGNVLGSSGSVVPIFRKQISIGGPVKVTHPEVTRYFMTIPEAVGLVLQCGTLGQGGEIFVLDMGEPIKILDMARQMIQLSGYVPDKDIEIVFTGLRPGEKLYEELKHNDEAHSETPHPRIFRFISQPYQLEQVRQFFEELKPTILMTDRNKLKLQIRSFVPEYSPHLD